MLENYPEFIKIIDEFLSSARKKSIKDHDDPLTEEEIIVFAFVISLIVGYTVVSDKSDDLSGILRLILSIEQLFEMVLNKKADTVTTNCECPRCKMITSFFQNKRFLQIISDINKKADSPIKKTNGGNIKWN
jgi:hypothetical protein